MILSLDDADVFPNINSIKCYLHQSRQHGAYIKCGTSCATPLLNRLSTISYCVIDSDNYKQTSDTLDNIVNYLKNGAIILFLNWFNNINQTGEGVRDAVLKWLSDNKLAEFIDFPIDNIYDWNYKCFIYRKNELDYVNWSDG